MYGKWTCQNQPDIVELLQSLILSDMNNHIFHSFLDNCLFFYRTFLL